MHLSEHLPIPALSAYVKCYRIIDFAFPHHDPIPPKAYTPRPEHCLQFFLTPTKIDYKGNLSTITPKNALLFGQHSIVNMRTVYQRFLSLQIVFEPGALYKLLNIPAKLFTNTTLDAELILGNEIETITDQLYHARSHNEMINIAERYVFTKVQQTKGSLNQIDRVAKHMLNLTEAYSLDKYVGEGFVSSRQFNRRFMDSVGVSPKAFLRIARFDQAYRFKNANPKFNWFNIAISCGYYDYQHLSKDYQDFTGYTPVDFFAIDSPERLLGTEEVY